MKQFKNERNWSDLERIDRVVLLSGVMFSLVFMFGLYKQNMDNIKKFSVNNEYRISR